VIFLFFLNVSSTESSLSPCYEEHNATNERHCAGDRSQRYVVLLLAGNVSRSDASYLSLVGYHPAGVLSSRDLLFIE
jgi:hypothetical protein